MGILVIEYPKILKKPSGKNIRIVKAVLNNSVCKMISSNVINICEVASGNVDGKKLNF